MKTSLNPKKISPADVFVTILEGDELIKCFGDVAAPGIKRNRPSGVEFIDQLADLISHYKKNTTRFYEKQMGLHPNSIHSFMLLYTGMGFKQWLDQYLLLAAKELFLQTDYKLDAVAKRLGYSGISSFSYWYRKLAKEWPSDRRYWDRNKQAKLDAELLTKIKHEQNKDRVKTEILP